MWFECKLLNCIVWCVGGSNNCVNAHSLMREQLEAHLNRHRNLAQIVHLLHETYEPLISISKLPTIPQLGVNNSVSTYNSTLALIVFFSYYKSIYLFVYTKASFSIDLLIYWNVWMLSMVERYLSSRALQNELMRGWGSVNIIECLEKVNFFFFFTSTCKIRSYIHKF